MITEAFFWFLLLAELAAIILLIAALLEKIRHISKTYFSGLKHWQITSSPDLPWSLRPGSEVKSVDSRGQPREGVV